MHRRRFLHAATVLGTAPLVGCLGGGDDTDTPADTTAPASTPTAEPTDEPTETPGPTPSPTPAGPTGVYVQSFRETMATAGTATAGDYRAAAMLTIPHQFWTVTGTDREEVPIEDADDLHLMAVVWDPETGTVLPDVGLSVEITQDDELVSQEVIYPMLSQRMGFHYGANFGLSGDGQYTARFSVGGVSAETTGAFAGRFAEGGTLSVPFEWTQTVREGLTSRPLDAAGDRGALRPMDMEAVPQARAPTREALPGTVLGTGRSDDAKLVATQFEADAAGGLTDGSPYLAVSARTPYNRLTLPSMALSATVERDGDPLVDGQELARRLDPDLGYHYGVSLPEPLESGDELTLSVGTPPQLARHEGYERAFLQMDPTTITV